MMRTLSSLAERLLTQDGWTNQQVMGYRRRLFKNQDYHEFKEDRTRLWSISEARDYLGLWITKMSLPNMIRIKEAAPEGFDRELRDQANKVFAKRQEKSQPAPDPLRQRFQSYGGNGQAATRANSD
jgi:hypothetical protein